mmetsp:Transcript_14962/g.24996  ORF Transcript_14962/g.24996 Transcript_14962/m.24996 type:complete len:354 (-) Transcript_14962:391-1452(-)
MHRHQRKSLHSLAVAQPIWVNDTVNLHAREQQQQQLHPSFEHIAVGMMVSKPSANERGGLLAAAWKTWMYVAPDLDALLLSDSCRPGSISEPLPSWMKARRGHLYIRCFDASRGGSGVNLYKLSAFKMAVLWHEMLTVLGNKMYYLKVDTDTLLEPRQLLKFLRHIHNEVSGIGRMVYFGTDEFTAKLPAVGHITGTPVWANLTRMELAQRRRVAALSSSQWSVPYAQGGGYGLSLAAVRALVQSDCLSRVAQVRSARTFYPGVPLIISHCFHPWAPCACSSYNRTLQMTDCMPDRPNAKPCNGLGSITMHKMKRVEWYEQCWRYLTEPRKFESYTWNLATLRWSATLPPAAA